MHRIYNVTNDNISIQKCNDREIYLDPLIVHVDFEKAVIEASKKYNWKLYLKLDSLAFLPENKVLERMDFLRMIMSPEATDLVDYFAYITIKLRNIAPLYPPSIWNVYQTTLDNGHRTNNETEGWNHRFSKLVGHNYSSIWSLIKKMRLELSYDETKLAQFILNEVMNVKIRRKEGSVEK
ncbi:FLYWCH-type domain-containing protein [Aphis craccivora]|uniref:FLYWCH-type domain-containing protein n=1 Tax=Aphis craccivora TaxID=307492 RepID=A0A6G0Z8H8_APHCR|nr:FLYWCH-type domain-containing protein [Aphis craccivora]